nr:hypothetical protein [Streptomyces sp. CBMA29]
MGAVATGALGAIAWQGRAGKTGTPVDSGSRVATAAVVRTDLSNSQTLKGTLGYGRPRAVKGGKPGLVTWLPTTGVTVRRGEPLYRVDNVPVSVFYGGTPLYRTLSARGTTGPDVKTVADNLGALGYDIGAQPSVGTWVTQHAVAQDGGTGAAGAAGGAGGASSGASDGTGTATGRPGASAGGSAPTTPAAVQVKRGDKVLTSDLIAAVKRWQTAAGLPSTGVLGVGDLAVLPGAVRVDGVQAQLADPADGTLMTVTSTAKSVSVAVAPDDAGSMKRGDSVTVALPDSSTAEGTIASISTSVQLSEGGAGDGGVGGPGQTELTVSITVGDTAAVRRLNSAPVDVRFTSETRKGVLAVPVGALLALSEGGYAVQLPGGRLVPVRTGMFSKGMVEISGSGISEGTKVVTTS